MPTISNRSIATFGAIVATFVTVAAATPLRAEGVQRRVSYADLDLRSPQGVAVLGHRIGAAATKVCLSASRSTLAEAAACRREAIARARASLVTTNGVTRIAAR